MKSITWSGCPMLIGQGSLQSEAHILGSRFNPALLSIPCSTTRSITSFLRQWRAARALRRTQAEQAARGVPRAVLIVG
jgi:hypothetical protein